MVFAYLDPAAGGMIIQSIIALAVAIPFILRSQISRGLERLRGRRVTKGPDDGQVQGDWGFGLLPICDRSSRSAEPGSIPLHEVVIRRVTLVSAPALLAVSLVLGAYIQTAGHPFEMVRPLVVAAVGATAVTLISWALTRRLLLAAGIGIVIVSWVLGRELALLPIGVALGATAFHLWTRWRGRPSRSLPTALIVGPPLALYGLAVYQLVAGGIIAFDDFSLGRPDRAAAATEGELPSMYVLLLDGYPRADELHDAFGYDNGPFIEELGTLGFLVHPDATSTFGGTSWTLASTMLDEPSELEPYADIDSTPDLWATLRELRRTYLVSVPMMDRLREAGYRLEYTATGVDLSEWRGWDETHDSGQLTDTEALLIQRSPFAHKLASWVMDQLRSRVDDALEAWVGSSRDRRQKVSFAHVMAPHAPLLWGPDELGLMPRDCWFERGCSMYTVIAEQLGLSKQEFGKHLGWQLDAVNRRVGDAVAQITEADPSAIVVVMSDHGARYQPHSPERFHTFLATRIPHEPDLLSSDPGPDGLFVRLFESVTQ